MGRRPLGNGPKVLGNGNGALPPTVPPDGPEGASGGPEEADRVTGWDWVGWVEVPYVGEAAVDRIGPHEDGWFTGKACRDAEGKLSGWHFFVGRWEVGVHRPTHHRDDLSRPGAPWNPWVWAVVAAPVLCALAFAHCFARTPYHHLLARPLKSRFRWL